jgi:hypothetical protein
MDARHEKVSLLLQRDSFVRGNVVPQRWRTKQKTAGKTPGGSMPYVS